MGYRMAWHDTHFVHCLFMGSSLLLFLSCVHCFVFIYCLFRMGRGRDRRVLQYGNEGGKQTQG